MASSKSYLAYVTEQLAALPEVSFWAMMGEYVLYYRGKAVGGIYDDRLLVKETEAARRLLPDAPLETPYPGGREMRLADVDRRELLERLIPAVAEELPAPKCGKKRDIRK